MEGMKMTAVKKPKVVNTKGKKKTAIARVTIKNGKGSFKVNKSEVTTYKPEYSQTIITEPIVLAEDVLGKDFSKNLSISATINGGGVISQAHACRTALGKALVEWTGSKDLKKKFLEYDRSMLVNDVRQKESKKFLRKGARAKPIKSYR